MIEDIEKEDSDYNKILESIKDMTQIIYDSIELITESNNDSIQDIDEIDISN